MRMYDIIQKKKHSQELNSEEINFFVNGINNGTIPDYQTSAFLMAVYFNGMTMKETSLLTLLMAQSGDTVNLSSIEGYKVDKHSTGGVGDKTSMIVVPIVAACGIKVAKMSGRGLGHTGGTIDKLESIPNFKTNIKPQEFFSIVNDIGAAIIGQTGNLAPVDKKLYALRDVTATVDSIPLIAASIISKKIASGADGIVLDVKTGSGAFAKTIDDAIALAKTMVLIGTKAKKDITAIITDMARPLGNAVGNSIEVAEAVKTLKGNGPDDLTKVSLELAANMILLAKKLPFEMCLAEAKNAIANGTAFDVFCKMVKAQGGNNSYLINTDLFPKAKFSLAVKATQSGYVKAIDTEIVGICSCMLGAGRETKESNIDYSAGIFITLKPGDNIKKGQIIATLLTNKNEMLIPTQERLLSSITLSQKPVKSEKIIKARITKDEIKIF